MWVCVVCMRACVHAWVCMFTPAVYMNVFFCVSAHVCIYLYTYSFSDKNVITFPMMNKDVSNIFCLVYCLLPSSHVNILPPSVPPPFGFPRPTYLFSSSRILYRLPAKWNSMEVWWKWALWNTPLPGLVSRLSIWIHCCHAEIHSF